MHFTLDHMCQPIWGTKDWQCKIWIVAESRFLDLIEYVRYYLHPTFEGQYAESFRRDSNFRAVLTCWGSFTIKATVFLKSGNSLSLDYFFNHEQFEPQKPVIKFEEIENKKLTDKDLFHYYENKVRTFNMVSFRGEKEHSASSQLLVCAVYENCEFDNVSFRGTDISGSVFKSCKFHCCDLSNIKAVNCEFLNTDFTNSILHPKMFLFAEVDKITAEFIHQEGAITERIPKGRNFGEKEFEAWITKISNPFINMEPKTKSVFISYAHQDQKIATVLDQWLRDQGIKTYLDKTNFRIGGDLYDEMSNFIELADKVVIIYSSYSKNRPFTTLERRMTQNRENESGQHISLSIYLVVDDTELPPEQKHRLAIMAKGKETKHVFSEILRGILDEEKLPEKINIDDFLSGKEKLF